MELTGTYELHAPVERAWDLLMDITTIGKCLPGCRGLQPAGTDRYEVELGVTIAAIAGSFKGTVALEDKDPPHAYTLAVEGSGRQGFITGHARVTLAADGDRTRVQIAAQADVGGMIARVGQRLLEGVARTMMDRFYNCLAKQVEESRRPEHSP
jgi:carbon monoxide dehydrogenase subunit G